MSVLAPLFFLGSLAIALPILFHLIRRQPRGRIDFSSLMFLEASPPRLSRRSRLDNLLLLMIRGLVLLMIAAAFTRPFWRASAFTSAAPAQRLTVLLVDRSASMQRGDLWQRAVDRAAAETASLRPTDRVALVAFDSQAEVLKGFEESEAATSSAVSMIFEKLRPTWRPSDLGRALVTAADLIEDATRAADVAGMERNIVLISDMQAGSSVAELRGYQWPPETQVRIARVATEESTNAAVGVHGDSVAAGESSDANDGGREGADSLRVRVSNAADSGQGRFSVRWIDASGAPLGSPPVSVTVPPGATRIIRIGAPSANAVAIELSGDDHPFDNRCFVALPEPISQTMWFFGADREDPRDSLLYYLERVAIDRPGRTVSVQSGQIPAADLSPTRVPLVVIASPPPAAMLTSLKSYLADGGRILAVVDQAMARDAAAEAAVRSLSGDESLRINDAEVADYALLTRIDFSSELFAPLADPRFSDFSKIQFWTHQRIAANDGSWNLLAQFDDGDPALLERRVGEGSLWVLAAGWQPSESQLALSSKFVPMIAGMIGDGGRSIIPDRVEIGRPTSLPWSETAAIVSPSGERTAYGGPADAAAIDQPGIYRYVDGEIDRPVAVNVAASESQTEPMDRMRLEQLGVRFGDPKKAEREARQERQMRDVELEKRQQWWRVLLLAALGLIGLETLLSRRSGNALPADPAAVGHKTRD